MSFEIADNHQIVGDDVSKFELKLKRWVKSDFVQQISQ
jgi:hypothetical protein